MKARLKSGFVALLICAAVAAACSDDPTKPGPIIEQPIGNGPAVLLVGDTSAVRTDTIEAPSPLRVRVLNSAGFASARTSVVFSVVPDNTTGALLTLEPVGASSPLGSGVVTTETDADGFATVNVKLGTRVGTSSVRVVSVPTQTTMTVKYAATPGRADRTVIRDTISTAGKDVRFFVQVFDRRSNSRTDAVEFTSTGAVASITTAGVARTLRDGIERIRVAVITDRDILRDSAQLFVVPAVPLAWSGVSGTREFTLYTGSIGGGRTPVNTSGTRATWQPGRNRIAYNRFPDFVVEDIGGTRTIHSGIPGRGAHGDWPEYSPDGQLLYYSSFELDPRGVIYRSRPDGSEAVAITAPELGAQMPSVSPDGASLAFATVSGDIEIMTLATGSVRGVVSATPNAQAHSPRWSPDGQYIAYLSMPVVNNTTDGLSTLRLVQPATGVQQQVGTATWGEGLSWSPDGLWIIGTAGPRLSTGNLKPSVFMHVPSQKHYVTSQLGEYPAWKR